MVNRLIVRIGAEIEHLHPRINTRLRACAGVVHEDAVLDVDVHRFCRVVHQRRIRLPALDIVTAKQFVFEIMQHAQFAQRMLHFADRAVGNDAHRNRYGIDQCVSPGNHLQLRVEKACDLGAINRF